MWPPANFSASSSKCLNSFLVTLKATTISLDSTLLLTAFAFFLAMRSSFESHRSSTKKLKQMYTSVYSLTDEKLKKSIHKQKASSGSSGCCSAISQSSFMVAIKVSLMAGVTTLGSEITPVKFKLFSNF